MLKLLLVLIWISNPKIRIKFELHDVIGWVFSCALLRTATIDLIPITCN